MILETQSNNNFYSLKVGTLAWKKHWKFPVENDIFALSESYYVDFTKFCQKTASESKFPYFYTVHCGKYGILLSQIIPLFCRNNSLKVTFSPKNFTLN